MNAKPRYHADDFVTLRARIDQKGVGRKRYPSSLDALLALSRIEALIQILTEERDTFAKDRAFYKDLAGGLEDGAATLRAQVAELQSTVDTLRAALEEIAGDRLLAHSKAMQDIARTALSTTKDREGEP